MRLNVVSEVATNINTSGKFLQIADLISLRHWLHSNNRTKLYIFDELHEHAYRRRAMSSKNVGIIQLFPQISKARARLLGIGQNLLKIDKDILDETWVHGIFIKKTRKKTQLISHLLPKKFVFNNIPKTSIPFDPYVIAPFTEKPTDQTIFKDEDLQTLWQWAENKKTWKQLGFAHPQQFNRFVRKNTRKLLNLKLSHITTNSVED